MRKYFFTIIQYIFFLGLGILFVWLSVKNITQEHWLQIKLAVSQARHWVIVPVVGMLLLSHYLRALRWRILMEPMGYHPGVFNTFAAVMIGYLVNSGVPRLGEVVKCTILSKYENVRADKLVGTIVMERAVDMVSLLVVFILALVFQGNVIGDYVKDSLGTYFANAAGDISIGKIIIMISILAVVFAVGILILKQFAHINIIGKIKVVILGILHGLSSIRHIKNKGVFIFHSVAIWMLYLGSTTMGILALQETDHLGIGGGLTTLAVGSVGMILTPGGIGAYPLLVAKLMGLYGIDEKTIGNALGWLLWSVQTLLVIVAGVIFFVLLSYYNKKQKVENGNPNNR
jgi:glycosyltransferase 2 family protein